jgi:hypothetical protein
VETVVEILGLVGFLPGLVRKEIIQFEQRGWFEIGRSGDELWCRLKDGIDMPLQPGAETDHAKKEEFDPMQPAEPGSLLAKVQQAQREIDTSARRTHAGAGTDDGAGPGGCTRRVTELTGREQICKVLAGGQHLSTMEIYAALKTRGLEISRNRTYALIGTFYREGMLCRDELEGSKAVYCYWLAPCSPAADEPQAAGAEPVLPQTLPSAPLMISVHLRGVELSLQECGELLQEMSDLWLLRRLRDGKGLIQTRFTIKGVDLSLAELREVASCLAQAAMCLGSGSRPPQTFDDDIFPECARAT